MKIVSEKYDDNSNNSIRFAAVNELEKVLKQYKTTYVGLDEIASALIEFQPAVLHDVFHLSKKEEVGPQTSIIPIMAATIRHWRRHVAMNEE